MHAGHTSRRSLFRGPGPDLDPALAEPLDGGGQAQRVGRLEAEVAQLRRVPRVHRDAPLAVVHLEEERAVARARRRRRRHQTADSQRELPPTGGIRSGDAHVSQTTEGKLCVHAITVPWVPISATAPERWRAQPSGGSGSALPAVAEAVEWIQRTAFSARQRPSGQKARRSTSAARSEPPRQ